MLKPPRDHGVQHASGPVVPGVKTKKLERPLQTSAAGHLEGLEVALETTFLVIAKALAASGHAVGETALPSAFVFVT